MHVLAGAFILEEEPLDYEGKLLSGFSISFTNKTRKYFVESKKEYEDWLRIVKKVIGYQDLNEIFEIKEKLGAGKYGIVKKCVLKSNKREVAIKIITKKNLKLEEMQLTRNEIEILKICQNPNIIKLYDILENHKYIYISKLYIHEF